jgi:DNA polymerase (family 10)
MKRYPSNQEIAEILSEIGGYLEMQDVPFKPRAYEKVAQIIGGMEENIADIYKRGGLKALLDIPGVGTSIAQKIEEYLKTGKVKYHLELKKKTPVDLAALTAVEGLGPKSIKKLYRQLGIKTLADLERAARAGKIRNLAGFGKKSEENILKGIEFLKKSGGRRLLGFVEPEIRKLEEALRRVPGVEKLTIAGSIRRRKETIGDVDILAVSSKPKLLMDCFVNPSLMKERGIEMPPVVRVYAKGETKSAIRIASGLDVDLRVVPATSYGAALNYFTGSKDHNIALRQIAIGKGYKLNEYGLFKGRRQIAGKTEEDIYRALGMDYIPPEMRENTGEIELAQKHALPKLIDYGDLDGDLQVQTNWSDGNASIWDMAKAAMARGLKYIAITDHTQRLAMARGLDEKRILKQMAEIDRINKKLRASGAGFRVLKGTECDILKDGSLDLPDSVLAKLDVVGASVHSYFNLSRKEQTERIKRAMRNPRVDIIFHPTGRVIERRPAYDVDMSDLIQTAKRTGTIMEVDAYPDRLDLKDEHIRECVAAGVRLAIDSDAHAPNHFDYLEYGIAQARRGWAERKDVINAWPWDKMLKMLK